MKKSEFKEYLKTEILKMQEVSDTDIEKQKEFNAELEKTKKLQGVKETKVEFIPNPNGRFNVSWVPPIRLQNKVIIKNGIKYPGNEHSGAFGCDSYDISGTTDGQGSKGALHGLTKFSME